MKTLNGSCCCGSIEYTLDSPFRDIVTCHCLQCRKMSGHFTASTSVSPAALHIKNDSELGWYRTSPEAQRGFCKTCGSTLFWKPDSNDRISVFVGAIDDPIHLPTAGHIYTAEKGNYYDLNDQAPQFQTSSSSQLLSINTTKESFISP